MRELPIGIFDSGLGGLTVAGEIMRALPDESIVYVGDTVRCPYGPRSQQEVRSFVLQIGAWLSQQPVKLIVIACNTATAAGLALAQKVFDVPVIGVVEPGARAAVKATLTRRVGVIGTVGTIESGAYSEAVRALDAGVTVFSVATPRFVEVVEQGLRLGDDGFEDLLAKTSNVYIRPSFYKMARDYLNPLKRNEIDTLVLGCTHFPLLAAPIQQVFGPKVRLISSAEETAREVADTLAAKGNLAEAGAKRSEQFVTTGDAEEFGSLGGRVLGRKIEAVTHLPLERLEEQLTDELRASLAAYEREAPCS